jgi:hypothetical protein
LEESGTAHSHNPEKDFSSLSGKYCCGILHRFASGEFEEYQIALAGPEVGKGRAGADDSSFRHGVVLKPLELKLLYACALKHSVYPNASSNLLVYFPVQNDAS